MAGRIPRDTVAIIGIGRFGTAVAEQLMTMGREVLAIDEDPVKVERIAPRVTLAVEADATSPSVLRQLGVHELPSAVVAIGSSLENSILATATLEEIGVRQIWARAANQRHARILEKVGAYRIVSPELEMGNRVAHLLMGQVNEYIEFSNGYAITMVPAPKWIVGMTVADSHLLDKHQVSVVGLERTPGEIDPVSPTSRIHGGDRLVIAGRTAKVERFALKSQD